jgi:hypothetical protein
VRAEGAVKRRMISVNRTADATASCCACATSPKCVDALTRYGAVTRDGKSEAVEGIVALRGADAGRLVAAVREKLASCRRACRRA